MSAWLFVCMYVRIYGMFYVCIMYVRTYVRRNVPYVWMCVQVSMCICTASEPQIKARGALLLFLGHHPSLAASFDATPAVSYNTVYSK